MPVAESVQYPWERTLTDPNKVPYYVKYAHVLFLRKTFAVSNTLDYNITVDILCLSFVNVNILYKVLLFVLDFQPCNRNDTVGSPRNG